MSHRPVEEWEKFIADWEAFKAEFLAFAKLLEPQMLKEGLCIANCEHDGICMLRHEHLGQHNSGYCKW